MSYSELSPNQKIAIGAAAGLGAAGIVAALIISQVRSTANDCLNSVEKIRTPTPHDTITALSPTPTLTFVRRHTQRYSQCLARPKLFQ